MVTNPKKMNKQDWERRVKESHNLVKAKLTKKLRIELGID
jgi:predicted DNA-binding protein (MmcQ/YjbR family)